MLFKGLRRTGVGLNNERKFKRLNDFLNHIGEFKQLTLAFAYNLPTAGLTVAVDHKADTHTEKTILGTLVCQRMVQEPVAQLCLSALEFRTFLWRLEIAHGLCQLLVFNRPDIGLVADCELRSGKRILVILETARRKL